MGEVIIAKIIDSKNYMKGSIMPRAMNKLLLLLIIAIAVLISINSCFFKYLPTKTWPKDWPVNGLDLPKGAQIVESSKGPVTNTWFVYFNCNMSHQQVYDHFAGELKSLGFKLVSSYKGDYFHYFVDSSDTIKVTHTAWSKTSAKDLGYEYEITAEVCASPLGLYKDAKAIP